MLFVFYKHLCFKMSKKSTNKIQKINKRFKITFKQHSIRYENLAKVKFTASIWCIVQLYINVLFLLWLTQNNVLVNAVQKQDQQA